MKWIGTAKTRNGITYINGCITKDDMIKTVAKKRSLNKRYKAVPIEEVAMSFFEDDVMKRLQLKSLKEIETITVVKSQ